MKKKKSLKNILVIFTYSLVLCVIPVTIVFFGMISNKLGEHIRYTMKDSADLCAEMIERQYESDILMLEGLSVRMATSLEDDPVLAMTRLVSTAERYGMKRITFSFVDGTTLSTDSAVMDLSDVENFEQALKEQRYSFPRDLLLLQTVQFQLLRSHSVQCPFHR